MKSDTYGTGPPQKTCADHQKVPRTISVFKPLIKRDYHCHQLLFTRSICIYNVFTSFTQNLLTQSIGGSHGKSTALSESPSPSSKYWASTLGKQEHCLVLLITRHKHSIQCQVRWGDGLNVLLIFYTKFITYSNKSEKLTHLVTNFWGSPKWRCVQAVFPGPH